MAAKRKSSGSRNKGGAPGPSRRAAGGEAARSLPAPDGDAPLHELGRDALSVLLYTALLPEENLRLFKDLGLSVPGFRPEGLSEVERCDAIADEIRAVPEERTRVLELLRNGFGRPPLVAVPLDERAARDLVDVGTTEHGMVLALWRLLADPAAPVRAVATPLLDRMVQEYYGPPGEGPEPAGDPPPGVAAPGPGPSSEGKLASLKHEVARAREAVERTRERADERAEKLQAQLKEARAAEAKASAEAARAREAAEQARRAQARAEEALAAARETEVAVELEKARAEARALDARLAGAESRAGRAEARLQGLAEELAAARRAAKEPAAATVGAAPAEADEPEEAPASWLFPVYTREFYDSLNGWERRIQRAAFKQANLLAQDHRHPSLRALPLEGLPGYYRVRVATDVRLIYRRGEDQGAVEILSLIDREDLDRYVRQAKTRGG